MTQWSRIYIPDQRITINFPISFIDTLYSGYGTSENQYNEICVSLYNYTLSQVSSRASGMNGNVTRQGYYLYYFIGL